MVFDCSMLLNANIKYTPINFLYFIEKSVCKFTKFCVFFNIIQCI